MCRLSKTVVLVAGLLAVLAFSASAKGVPGVKYTVHNMSKDGGYSLGGYLAKNEDEICIFCHTPHGGNLNGPLWNRPINDSVSGVDLSSAGYFTHYTSATLTPAINAASTRAVSDISLLCMTCHDGTIATNRVLNVSNRTTPDPTNPTTRIEHPSNDWVPIVPDITSWPNPGPIIGSSQSKIMLGDLTGGDLTDDHPVSFNYTTAYTADTAGLHTLAEAQTAGVRFFNGSNVECSTCHDPHVDYGDPLSGSPNSGDANYTKYTPFLYKSNENSALCLACHVK